MKEYYESMIRLTRWQLGAGWLVLACGILSVVLIGLRLYLGVALTTTSIVNLVFLPIGIYFVRKARRDIAEYRRSLRTTVPCGITRTSCWRVSAKPAACRARSRPNCYHGQHHGRG